MHHSSESKLHVCVSVCVNCRREKSIQISTRIMINWCDENLKIASNGLSVQMCGLAYSTVVEYSVWVFYMRMRHTHQFRLLDIFGLVLFVRDAVGKYTRTNCMFAVHHITEILLRLWCRPLNVSVLSIGNKTVRTETPKRFSVCPFTHITQHPHGKYLCVSTVQSASTSMKLRCAGKGVETRVFSAGESKCIFAYRPRDASVHWCGCCRPRGKIICFVCI